MADARVILSSLSYKVTRLDVASSTFRNLYYLLETEGIHYAILTS